MYLHADTLRTMVALINSGNDLRSKIVVNANYSAVAAAHFPVSLKHCGIGLFILPVVVIAVAVAAGWFQTRVGRKHKEFASAGSTFPSRRSTTTCAGKHLEEVSSHNFLLLSRFILDSCCVLQVML